jgi:hypothetical protein
MKPERRSPRDRLHIDQDVPVFVKFQAVFPKGDHDFATLTEPAVRLLAQIYGDLPGMMYHSGTLSSEARIEMLPQECKSHSGWYELPPQTLVDGPVWRHMKRERSGYLSFWRFSALRELQACAWEFDWRSNAPDEDTLRCEVSILDARRDQLRTITELFDSLMEAAARGRAFHASAEPYVAARFWKGFRSAPTMTRVNDTRSELEANAWSSMKDKAGYVPSCTWYNLLSPEHLKKLGGYEQFRDEAKASTTHGQLAVCSLPNGYATLNVYPDLISHFDNLGYPLDLLHHQLDWPHWRFVQAGLLMWQCQSLLDHRHLPGMSEREPTRPDDRAARGQSDEAFAAYIERLWAHPPTCVLPNCTPVKGAERKAVTNAYGRAATGFLITRSDKPEAHSIWLRRRTVDGEIKLVDPVYVGGPTRQSSVFVFDGARHGFDGEFGQAAPRSKKAAEPFHCPRCGHDKFFCTAIFQYSGENNEELDDASLIARVQDFFSWFALRTRCGSCKHSAIILDIECA